MSVVLANSLCFSYPNSSKKALDDVSFAIEKGSYTAIVGANGSGKSTLAKLICGLEIPSSGCVEVEKGLRIGMVFQSPKNQIVSSIVSRDTAFGPQSLGLKKDEVELRTIECLNITDMLDKAHASTSALSLGQTQKIAMSGMLAVWPDILIMDEALSMLDKESRETMYEILSYLHKTGKTIIHITHSLESVKYTDNVIAFEKGKKIFYGTTNAFFKNDELVEKIRGPKILPCEKSFEQNLLEKEISFVFDDVSFSYDEKSSVNNISFALEKGSLTVLSGPSGAGKSTILEIASGILEKKSGAVYASSRPALVQQNCEAAIFEAFAADDVAFGPKNLGKKGRELKTLVKKSMNDASIPFDEFAERHTSELSGGELRRVAIAGILALDSDIVFFDEPTAGLDGYSRFNVMNMMRHLADEGKTVLFSSHKDDEIAFADREISILKGILAFDSNPIDIGQAKKSENLQEQKAYSASSMVTGLRNTSAKLSGHENMNASFITKFAPVARISVFTALFVLSLVFKNIYLNIGMFLISLLYCKLCGFKYKKLLLAYVKILPFLLIFAVFQIMFRRPLPDEILFTSWRWFCISPSKLMFCASTMLRTYASLGFISGFYVSTPEYDFIDGMKILLTPLALIKIPVRYFMLIVEIIFRFIPLLIDEAAGIMKTQIIRGGLGKADSTLKKIKAVIPLIVPLVIQTIRRSDYLAEAVTMRGFK